MEQKVLKEGLLLDKNGDLVEAGYATRLVKEYDRNMIKARKLRIKEWDYYYIGNNDYAIALTIDDNSYMGLGSISFLNFNNGFWKTVSSMSFMPKGKTSLPSTSKIGDVFYKSKKMNISFYNDGKTRHLLCDMKKFHKDDDFSCDITLYDEIDDSLVIATPFEKKKHFYYNQKINCLKVKGFAKLGSKEYDFTSNESYAVLDWGRGVWTYKNTWYWSSLSTSVDGIRCGFNLGYGFGCNKDATENIIFYDGKGYKVDEVVFNIPKNEKGQDDFLSPWTIKSNDSLVDLTFTPILDRNDDTDVLVIKSLQHQVFGKFNGTLKAGEVIIKIKDKVSFAEKVTNWW